MRGFFAVILHHQPCSEGAVASPQNPSCGRRLRARSAIVHCSPTSDPTMSQRAGGPPGTSGHTTLLTHWAGGGCSPQCFDGASRRKLLLPNLTLSVGGLPVDTGSTTPQRGGRRLAATQCP